MFVPQLRKVSGHDAMKILCNKFIKMIILILLFTWINKSIAMRDFRSWSTRTPYKVINLYLN